MKLMNNKAIYPCLHCGKPLDQFRANRNAKYCSKTCSKLAWEEVSATSLYKDLSPSTVGTLHELMVACDLIKKGYHVFRALSPSCDCDLAILKNRNLIRIEVTTGYYSPNGKLFYPKHCSTRFDIIAVVTEKGIVYTPENLLSHEPSPSMDIPIPTPSEV